MSRRKYVLALLLLIISSLRAWLCFAQAPNISYPGPRAYIVNNPIASLKPSNTGGAVPPVKYGEVTTLAGSGAAGTLDAQGTTASFNQPRRLTVAAAGNIYVADFGNNLIREITPAGLVSTIKTAVESFDGPDGIAIDAGGNLYISDAGHNSIDKVTPFGGVSIIAGNGGYGAINGPGNMATFNYPIGIAMDKSGNIYVADYQNQLIRKIDIHDNVFTLAGSGLDGTNNGIGAAASFSYPNGVGVDAAGNVYVADGSSRLIRKIDPGGVVTTFAGAGQANAFVFGDPQQVVVDPSNNVYVTDGLKNQVMKITSSGVVSVVAGSGSQGSANGTGISASFNGPVGITIGGDGSLYVADSFNNLIRKISVYGYTIDKTLPQGLTFDPATGIITGTPTVASPATDYTVTAYNSQGSSSAIVNIAVDNVTPAIGAPILSYQSPQTYTVNTPIATLSPRNTGGAVPAAIYGQVSTLAGSGAFGAVNGTGAAASFHYPLGITVDGSGNLYVGDQGNSLIRKVSPAGVVSTLAGSGQTGSTNGTGTAASFYDPYGVTIDASGNIYVADEGDNLIREVSPAGVVTTFAGSGLVGSSNGPGTAATFNHPFGVAVDASGNVYVAEGANDLIRKITPAGVVTTFAGSGSQGSADGVGVGASFYDPEGIAVDALGNVYVSDSGNERIRKITPAGVVTTVAGSGAIGAQNGTGTAASFNYPFGITVDIAGNIYVVDQLGDLVRKISPTGVVSTFAGTGEQGSADGIGTAAGFYNPAGITADAFGDLYIADSFNNRIRKITATGYTIDKPLPPGLNFDPTTGNITGTPAASSPPTNYTVTGYNAGGSGSATVNITVTGGTAVVPPPNISYQTPQTYTVNVPITPLLPANTGGAVPANTYGLVTTYAGTGAPGNANGPADVATFGGPAGLAFDASGNLYVSELLNNDIRMITPAGIVTTFAGNGRNNFANGPGNMASFSSPYQIAVDRANNLYVADGGNDLIRKIIPGGVVSSYAGSGALGSANGNKATATFNNPIGVTFDPSGIMYVADQGNSTVRKIDLSGQVTTFAVFNGGAAPANNNAMLDYLTTDISGNLYYVNSNQVGSITPGGATTTIAGSGNPAFANGSGTSASFFKPVGVARSVAGFIYLSDEYNYRIRSVSPSGVVTTVAGEFGGGYSNGVGSTAAFSSPYGLALDATESFLYVADFGNNVVRKVCVTGYTIDKSLPTGLKFDPTTGTISGTPAITSPPETYTITAYNQGGSSATTVTIQIIDDESIVFGPLPSKTVCDADFDPGATGEGPITYTSTDLLVATIVSGKIHLTGAGTATITASDGTSQAAQTLTVTAAVTPTISITPLSPDTCAGKIMVFSAQISGGGTQPALQWQINGQNIGANSQEFSTSGLNNGDKVNCILTSNAPCTTSNTVTSNTAVFTVDPPISTSVKITASDTGLICKGTQVTFTAVAYSPDVFPTYQWQVNGINAGANQSTFTTTTLNDGDVVTCLVTSTGKCLIDPETTSNAIKISLNPQSQCIIEIPNTFTPNGDGVNDLWDITALQAYPGCTISIYNRGGSLVYNSINYPKPWDGTYNGKSLPVGTYYYVIDLKNGKKPLAGPVTIIR
jgi:gliding motility-associated-like protein